MIKRFLNFSLQFYQFWGSPVQRHVRCMPDWNPPSSPAPLKQPSMWHQCKSCPSSPLLKPPKALSHHLKAVSPPWPPLLFSSLCPALCCLPAPAASWLLNATNGMQPWPLLPQLLLFGMFSPTQVLLPSSSLGLTFFGSLFRPPWIKQP